MMLSSECYGDMTNQLMKAAHDLCSDRLIYTHEGGYSKDYVPFCGLAVIETLTGVECYSDATRNQDNVSERVRDPYLDEVNGWAYQDCQPHQKHVVDLAAGIHDLVGFGAGKVDSDSVLTTEEQSVLNAVTSLIDQSISNDRKSIVLEAITKHMQ